MYTLHSGTLGDTAVCRHTTEPIFIQDRTKSFSLGPCRLIFTWWRCCGLCLSHKPTELAHSFFIVFLCLFKSLWPFQLYFYFINSPDNTRAFSLCSSGLISALVVLSAIYLCMKAFLSPDKILCGWLGLKHQLTNKIFDFETCSRYEHIHIFTQ